MNILNAKNPNRSWYEIILWWELRRLPYNIVMYLAGMLSFYMAYVTIPLVYIIIGIGLNIFYTFGWLIEIIFIRRQQNDKLRIQYPRFSFFLILCISIVVVFGFAFYLMTG